MVNTIGKNLKLIIAGICIMLAIVFTGCQKSGPVVITATPTVSPTAVPATATPTPAPAPSNTIRSLIESDESFKASNSIEKKLGESYSAVFESSMISRGNTYRLKKKLEAARNGSDLTVVFIGGSVTEGEGSSKRIPDGTFKKGYAYCTYEYIRDNFGYGDGSNVKYVNAGISGTASTLGIVRSDIDVLSYNPDIVFVEFAVNNSTTLFDKQSYESLIRKLLNAKSEPAVVLLFSAATYAGAAESYMIPIGRHYALPMVSMQKGLKASLSNGTIAWADFSADTVHPTYVGHELYAKVISMMLKCAFDDISFNEQDEVTTYSEYTIPEGASQKSFDKYENLKMIDNASVGDFSIDPGCFVSGTTQYSSFSTSHNHALKNGWYRSGNAEGEMTVTIKCETFIAVVKQLKSGSNQSLDVYVDGEYVMQMVTGKSDAWNNPEVYRLITGNETKEHVITIKASQGSEAASQTILAFGYTD